MAFSHAARAASSINAMLIRAIMLIRYKDSNKKPGRFSPYRAFI
jgi:hypothetical protein